MAPTHGVHTQKALDVSQNADSSPPHREGRSLRVEVSETIDRVEDSYPNAYKGDTMHRQRSDVNDENTYGVSPKQQSKARERSSRPTKIAAPVTAVSRVVSLTHDTDSKSVATTQRDTPDVPRGALDVLLANGATVHRCKPRGRPATHQDSESNPCNDQPDLLEGRTDNRLDLHDVEATTASAKPTSASTLGSPRSSPQPARRIKPSTDVLQPSGLPTPAITGKRPSVVAPNISQSAFEALRARRSGHAVTGKPAAKQVGNPIDNGRGLSQASAVQKPGNAVRSTNAGTTTKLQARQGEIQQPLDDALASVEIARSGKNIFNIKISTDDNITVGRQRQKKSHASGNDSTKVTKAPTRVQPRRGAKPDAINELAEADGSDESEKGARRLKIPRASKATAAKATSKSAAKGKTRTANSSLKGSTPGSLRRVRNQTGRPVTSKAQDQTKSASKTITAKNRMKPLRRDESDDTNVQPPPGAKNSTLNSTATISHETSISDGISPLYDVETPEDFESKTVQYDEDFDKVERSKNIPTNTADVKEGKEAVMHQLSASPSKDDGPRRILHALKRIDTNHGASLENAILLGEQKWSSPEEPESGGRPSIDLAETIVRHEKKGGPKTTAKMPSSPPVQYSSREVPWRSHLVENSVTRKSNIISFDKVGPRNQGSLLTRKDESRLSRILRSSVALSAMLPGSAMSSKRRRQHVILSAPSSTAARSKKTQITTESNSTNPAKDITKALGSFLTGPLLKGKERSDTPRPGRELSTQAAKRDALILVEDHNDDVFMNIGDMEAADISRRVQNSSLKTSGQAMASRTSSQKAMTPPALKSTPSDAPTLRNLQRLEQALTVPLVSSSTPPKANSRQERPTEVGHPAKRGSWSPLPDVRRSKRVRVTEHPALALGSPTVLRHTKVDVRQPNQSNARKPSRNASHGSQSVDMHGSPVPQGMVVEGMSTVLETFSQQTAVSSDHVEASAVIARRSRPPPASNSVLSDVPLRPPPSVRPRRLASNVKPRPAPPEEHSTTITRHAKTLNGQLLVDDRSVQPGPGPFTSSENSQYAMPVSSSFMESLRQIVDEHNRAANQKSEDVDPEKTLVELRSVRRSLKRIRSPSPALLSSSEGTPENEEPIDAVNDIGGWRQGLLPHQVNFFDNLVIVSHTIVRHLVDREIADGEMVHDYRSRGLQVVEALERKQAAEYQAHYSNMQAKKKRLRTKLESCSRRLKNNMEQAAAAAREKRATNDGGTNDAIQDLKSLIEEFC